LAKLFSYKLNTVQQFTIILLVVALVSIGCFLLIDLISYKIVALILLVTVSLIAMLFDIAPVLFAAFISAITWDFFFIPPKFTLSIQSPEDILLFTMYFVIALIHAVLTYKIRQYDKLEQKREEKENTLSLYNTILNSLSHELRTPIATIIGATDNLQSGSKNLSENNKIELISEISNASLRLNRQVENLLNMSRLESGTYQLKMDWCDVCELVYNVVKKFKDLSKGHKIQIEISPLLPLCKIDSGLIEQVLYNLIQNAITYIPLEATIKIKASYKANQLTFVIEDDGPGFPENEISNVFDKFYRLKNTKAGGTGLGLSIVKGFIEAHKGNIILENKKESGAKFTINIPCEISNLKAIENE